MKSFVFLLSVVFFLLLSSCATILNSPFQKINIITDTGLDIISIKNAADNNLIDEQINQYYVKRSHNPLFIQFQKDSLKYLYSLPEKRSFAYWLNIPYNYGLGLIVDNDNDKSFAYSKNNYFSVENNKIKRSAFNPMIIPKGTICASLGMPLINFYNLKTNSSYKSTGGFLGIETGLNYYYKNNRFFSASIGAAINNPIPLPVGVDYMGEHETASVLYFNLRNNRVINRFDVGYGINFSNLVWNMYNYHNSDTNFRQQNIGAGLSLSAGYRVSKYFNIRLLYQPNIFNFNTNPVINYQHFVSLELIWNFIPTSFKKKK